MAVCSQGSCGSLILPCTSSCTCICICQLSCFSSSVSRTLSIVLSVVSSRHSSFFFENGCLGTCIMFYCFVLYIPISSYMYVPFVCAIPVCSLCLFNLLGALAGCLMYTYLWSPLHVYTCLCHLVWVNQKCRHALYIV